MLAEGMKFLGAWFFAIQVLAAAPSTSLGQKKDRNSKVDYMGRTERLVFAILNTETVFKGKEFS